MCPKFIPVDLACHHRAGRALTKTARATSLWELFEDNTVAFPCRVLKRGKWLPPHCTQAQYLVWKPRSDLAWLHRKKQTAAGTGQLGLAKTTSPHDVLKPSRTLWGSWTWKLSVSPASCLWGRDASLHNLLWVPEGRSEQLLVREGRGCKDKGGAASKQLCSLGTRSGFPLMGYM